MVEITEDNIDSDKRVQGGDVVSDPVVVHDVAEHEEEKQDNTVMEGTATDEDGNRDEKRQGGDVVVDPVVVVAHDNVAEQEEEKKQQQEDNTWTELMGKDIQMKDITATSNGNGGTTKKECRPQDAVVIDFVGRLATNREDDNGPIFHRATGWLIVIGDKYVTPALEMGVRFMHQGQRAIIWSHSKFAYGLSTRRHLTTSNNDDGGDDDDDNGNNYYELPPNSNVRYEIWVKQVVVAEEGSPDPDAFQIKLAMSKKVIANDMFQNELYAMGNSSNHHSQGSMQRALRLYSKAADEMQHLIQSSQAAATKKKEEREEGDDDIADSTNINNNDKEKKMEQATEILLDCLNNAVAVYLKAKKYHEAKEAAVKVLTYDPNNFKALLRAARAAMLDPSGTYEESDAAIAAAEKVVQEKGLDDKDVRKLRQELKQRKLEYKQRTKEMMERMTKELKPKEPTEKQQQQQQNERATAEKDAATTSRSEMKPTVEEPPSLWHRLLPHVIQIILPLICWYVVVLFNKAHQQDRERMDGEL